MVQPETVGFVQIPSVDVCALQSVQSKERLRSQSSLCVRVCVCGSDKFISIECVNVCALRVCTVSGENSEKVRRCLDSRTEAGGVFGHRQLTEDRQAPAASLAAPAGLGAAERAGRAARILVLVRQGGVGQGAGPQRSGTQAGGGGILLQGRGGGRGKPGRRAVRVGLEG